ncbi:hypothetical protein G1K66_08420 [Tenacibaculum finnmarkense]|uniref:hypothetical protein n=1 Tax=Tenacibaculum finnmarkense TaxID=2781243 RepID=UPI001E607B78|nr:hypothetical protein [Tenacibaculum finnmarkense]MCD8431010.1 hypothetical protein [Tenacibaculum finnmarkense genomovar ulcerans]MCG8813284.1 hypothetical protein [Tenacibaculum finnmarkense]
MNELLESHSELLAIVQAYAATNQSNLSKSSYLKNKITTAIENGIKTRKSVVVATDS